jgi:hypothetical protein
VIFRFGEGPKQGYEQADGRWNRSVSDCNGTIPGNLFSTETVHGTGQVQPGRSMENPM